MNRLGLRGRVTLASALVLAVGLALITAGMNVLLARQLGADASAALHEHADAQLASVSVRNGHVVLRRRPEGEALDEQSWVYVHGRALRRAAAPDYVQRGADALAGTSHPAEREIADRVRLRAEPAYSHRRRVATVVVGVSLVPYDHTERLALVATLLFDVFLLAAGALVARRAVGNALRPVADMTDRVADWSEHDLDRRFNLGPPRDELTALSATLDSMLARIGASLRHEQRFSAEMAHELRTPLTGVRGEAELALHDPTLSADARESLERILRGTDRMAAVIETLMAVARSDAASARGAADAVRAAELAVDAVRSAADDAGVGIELIAPGGRWRVGADGEVVAQTLQPLLNNAIRHASGDVRLALHRHGDTVAFVVRDDGPGLDGHDPDALFEPGVSTTGGAGLGLPLARRLARACGGDVRALPGGPGAAFELRLPLVG